MMKKLSSRIRSFLRRSEGVSALEYAILVGVIAIAVGGAIATFGDQIRVALETLGGALPDDVARFVPDGGGDAGAGDGDGNN